MITIDDALASSRSQQKGYEATRPRCQDAAAPRLKRERVTRSGRFLFCSLLPCTDTQGRAVPSAKVRMYQYDGQYDDDDSVVCFCFFLAPQSGAWRARAYMYRDYSYVHTY